MNSCKLTIKCNTYKKSNILLQDEPGSSRLIVGIECWAYIASDTGRT